MQRTIRSFGRSQIFNPTTPLAISRKLGKISAPTGRTRSGGSSAMYGAAVAIAAALSLTSIPKAIAAPQTAYSTEAFLDSIGIGTHLSYLDTPYRDYQGLVKPLLQELQIRHIRDEVAGDDSNTVAKLQDLAGLGIQFNILLHPWVNPNPTQTTTLLKSLPSGSLASIEGPNEWDGRKRRDFVYRGQAFPAGLRLYHQELYDAVKRDPALRQIPILSPSLTTLEAAGQTGPLPCDYGVMHSYPGGEMPTAGKFNLDRYWLTKAQTICPQRDVIATESGWHNAPNDTSELAQPGVSERAASRYVNRLFLEYFNRGVYRTYLYQLLDQGNDPNDQEQNFGLVRSDGSRKPAFLALKHMIAILRSGNGGFSTLSAIPGLPSNVGSTGDVSPRQIDITVNSSGAVNRTVLYKPDGRFYVILWQEVPSYDLQTQQDLNVPAVSVTLQTQQPLSQADIYDPLVSATPINRLTSPGQISLSVTDSPIVVELTLAQ
jgi:hypothetical protein